MATEKKKVAVLTLSQQYQKGHPKDGLPTEFVEKLKSGTKLHTIRSNYELWAKRAEQINAGKMELSIRVWSGKPYRSQQVEVARLTKLGVQRVQITRMEPTMSQPLWLMASSLSKERPSSPKMMA